ncbi:MAG: hypothetical protein P8M22_09875 [Phycisphaerales bacterium]|nr:hypothetical protein [Phycisphaerales bacterium]
MTDQQQQDIARIISIVLRRERLNAGLNWFCMACLYIAVLAVLLAIVDRLGSQSWVPWNWLVIVMGSVAVIAGVAGWWLKQPEPLRAARRVDERLGLKDRLSSALACGQSKEPFARAVVEDAVTVARSPQTREQVRRRFRLAPPPFWWASPLLVLSALVIALFGQWDVFSASEVDTVDLKQVRANAAESVEASVEAIREDPQLSEAMAEVLEELEARTDASLEEKQNEESIRREALKRLTELNKNLETIVEGPEGQAMESVKESLESLEAPEDSPIKNLVDSLSKGDFDQAQQSLSKLQEKIDSGELSESERKQIADAMESLSEQLDKKADDQQPMRDALRQAGMDPELANDQEALKEALEQSKDLNESQKQKLTEKAEANDQAKKMLEDFSEASKEACKQCRNGQKGDQNSSSCKGMSDQLGKMQQQEQMLEKAKDAQSACQSQCNKIGQGLAKQSAVNAAGPKGESGKGDSVGMSQTETSTVAKQDSGEVGDGPVVSRESVDRDLDVGESTMTLRQAQQAASEGFDEALNDAPLPRQYHDALKNYFSNREAVEKAIEADAEASKDKAVNTPSDKASQKKAESGKDETKGEAGGKN